MNDQEVTANLKLAAILLEKVNANSNGTMPDVRSPEEILSVAADALELSRLVDICTASIVGVASQKLAGAIGQALVEAKTADDARASLRILVSTSIPETSDKSLYWAMMAIYNASRHKGGPLN